MPDPIILDDIPFQIDLPALLKTLRIKPQSSYARQVETMVREAQEIARPKAFFKLAFIVSRDDQHVNMDGILFTSRVLSRNLAETQRAIAYLVTCGLELDAWSRSYEDMLPHYWADVLMESAARQASRYLDEHLKQRFKLRRISSMHPGSLADWPITQQRELFSLLGDTQSAIGVTLTESMLMLPAKSVSGLCFAVTMDFESCTLCPRENCPTRHAPYDQKQVDKFLGQDKIIKT